MVENQRDYYDVLGVNQDADQKAIKNAFRKLTLKYHPDRNKSPESEERFKEIAEAYAILSDPEKRKRYDTRGFAGVANYSDEDLFGNINFGDIFNDLGFNIPWTFNGGIFDHIYNRNSRETTGRDIRLRLEVSLDTIYTGGEETIEVSHSVTCSHCTGSGTEEGNEPRQCSECGGTGQIITATKQKRDDSNVILKRISICHKCNGKGKIIDHPCSLCKGSGLIDKTETLSIKIPKGTEEGMILRIPGHGYASPVPGGRPGNLYVVIRSKPDYRFIRIGADLWITEKINVIDAILGTEIDIPSLTKTLSVKIHPGTQHDEVYRIQGRGLPYFESNKYGDINIRIQVEIPKKISRKERKIYEQLRDLNISKHNTKIW